MNKQNSSSNIYISLSRRLIASMLDLFIITIIFFPLMHPINLLIFGDRTIEVIMAELYVQYGEAVSGDIVLSTLASEKYFSKFFISQFCLFLMIGFYTIFFWHNYGATPGKFLLNCKIIDEKSENYLSVKHSAARFIGYIPSTTSLFIGFFMIDFDKKRRGLHDRIVGSVVIEDNRILKTIKHLRSRFSWK